MSEQKLRALLNKLKSGDLGVEEVLSTLKDLPFQDLGFAKIDHHRGLRCGCGEVIFCEGKTPGQVSEIAEAIVSRSDVLLGTRASVEHYEAVREKFSDAQYRRQARCIVYHKEKVTCRGKVMVICAGTSDIPVASEAAVTAETFGAEVELVNDVGVAGLHRLLSYTGKIRESNVIVVVAGMEGALASVVGGLSPRPVIGVPTSVGYGASLGGVAPLLTMLNSCAAGVTVVNIDNGFGAGYAAAAINELATGGCLERD